MLPLCRGIHDTMTSTLLFEVRAVDIIIYIYDDSLDFQLLPCLYAHFRAVFRVARIPGYIGADPGNEKGGVKI